MPQITVNLIHDMKEQRALKAKPEFIGGLRTGYVRAWIFVVFKVWLIATLISGVNPMIKFEKDIALLDSYIHNDFSTSEYALDDHPIIINNKLVHKNNNTPIAIALTPNMVASAEQNTSPMLAYEGKVESANTTITPPPTYVPTPAPAIPPTLQNLITSQPVQPPKSSSSSTTSAAQLVGFQQYVQQSIGIAIANAITNGFIVGNGTSLTGCLRVAEGTVIGTGYSCGGGGGTTIVNNNGSGTSAIGGVVTGATQGSVLFAGVSGALSQDNANFFFDDLTDSLKIGGLGGGGTQCLQASNTGVISGTGSACGSGGGGSGADTALSNLSAVAINTSLLLGVSDGGALGSTTKMWSDLFLATGAVINFNNGDVTLTHTTDTLTLGGGDLKVTAAANASGSVLTTDATQTVTNKNFNSGTNTFPTFNQNTTGSAATLTTPRSIYGNNFDGSASLNQVIASTFGGTGNGFAKFIGPATTEKTFTLPNASATILTSDSLVTVAQGGTGAGTLTGLLLGNGTSPFTATTLSSGISSVLSDETGSGALVFATSPTLVTPVLGVASATSLSLAGTLTGATGITSSGAITFSGLGGSGTQCLQVNNSGVLSGTGAGCGAGAGTVTSVSGTTNRITVTNPTTTPVIDISAAYVGQTSITTLGTIGTGTWQGTPVGSTYGGTGINTSASTGVPSIASGTWSVNAQLPLSLGGTNAALTASNGGILYSTASAVAVLSGTATAGQMLRSGASGAPSWSTATFPNTTTINQLLYSSAANTVSELATANYGILNTSSGGVPVITAAPTIGTSLTIGGAGIATGALNLAGTTSGVITLQSQAAAGTYNFNLPTAAGTSGYLLTSAGGGATAMTWTDPGALGVRWNSIAAPSGNASLAMGSNTTAFTFNGATTGNIFDISTNSLTSGNLVKLSSTSTAAISNLQTVLNVTTSGANSNSPQQTYAGKFTNTHSGTGSTNIAAYFTASGGALGNYAAIFDQGDVGIGTTTPFAKLHVMSSTTPQLWLSYDTSNYLTASVSSAGAATLQPSGNILNIGGGTSATDLRFLEASGNGSNYVGFKAPASLSGNQVWTLPTADSTGCVQSNGSGVLTIASCAGGAPFVYMNNISSATGIGSNDNTDYQQSWGWNTLTNHPGLLLYTNSTTASGSAQTVLAVELTGANASSSQSTYGAKVYNGHTGTGSTNYGARFEAQAGDTNIGAYFTASAGTNNYAAIFDSGNVGIGTTTPAYKLDVSGSAHVGSFGIGSGGIDSASGLRVIPTLSGSSTDFNGIYVNPNASLSSSIPNFYGEKIDMFSFGTGTSTDATGLAIAFSGGTYANAYGITVPALSSGTNNVGISVGGATGTKHTNLLIDAVIPTGAYSIYNASTEQNYFNGKLGIKTASPSTDFEIGSQDLGNGSAGPIITLGRNNNGTATGAGSMNFQKKDGTSGFVWQDNAGNMRINTSAPSNANDTSGTVIGAQTSTRNTKQDITNYTDYGEALQMVTSAPLHTFRYTKEVAGYGSGSPLAKPHIGFIADEVPGEFMWGNSIDQVSVNGLLMASVKALNDKVISLTSQLGAQQSYSNLAMGQPNLAGTPIVLASQLYLTGDNVGQAKILAGQTTVRISFSKPYQYQPIVTTTPNGKVGSEYWVSEKDSMGFNINIDLPSSEDITFDWHSFAGESAKLTVSDGTTSNITLVVADGAPVPTTPPSTVPSPAPTSPADSPTSGVVAGESTTSSSDSTPAVTDPPIEPRGPSTL